ncbi:MAG: chemotaxis protein CheA [Roseovarius sp.]
MSGADDFRESFFEECEELLEAMHDGFDQLSEGADDVETMNAVFRAVHSIKGGAGAFGFSELVAFAHDFETALDQVRSGKREADEELLELFRQCGDNLSDLVALARDHGDTPCDGSGALRDRLTEAIGADAVAKAQAEPDFEPVLLDLGIDAPAAAAERHYLIRFEASPGLFATGNDPVALFRTLAKLGDLRVTADLAAVPPLASLDPVACAISWQLSLETADSEAQLREVFEFVEGDCVLDLAEQASGAAAPEEPVALDAPAEMTLPSLASLISDADEAGADSGAAESPEDGAEVDDTAGADPNPARKAAEQAKPAGTIRVHLDKIDKLINLVGELVIKEAMLSQSVAGLAQAKDSDVTVGLESLKQLAGEIQEGVMAIRAQPVKPMFQRMARIVREAGSATGKRVRLVTIGEDTEVDKTVIERLVDPLTHMIRNAIDHGLESGEARAAAGKSPEGTVTLTAAHRSGRVMIDVADDGGGINREKVRALAIERGLIGESDTLSSAEIDNLLFLPGFSSKDEVSELSGRGVGLDVVRSEIHNLGGRVSIQSDPGEGTTFSISLPLTLAVLEGMVIRVADQTMVVPISAIQETLQPKTATIDVIGAGTRVLQNRSGLVPIIDLGGFFGFRAPPDRLDDQVLLLIETYSNQRFALIVDEIQDQRQVVIKSLETNYQQVGGVAAATILGDGRIALIIDPDRIIRDSGPIGASDMSFQLAV